MKLYYCAYSNLCVEGLLLASLKSKEQVTLLELSPIKCNGLQSINPAVDKKHINVSKCKRPLQRVIRGAISIIYRKWMGCQIVKMIINITKYTQSLDQEIAKHTFLYRSSHNNYYLPHILWCSVDAFTLLYNLVSACWVFYFPIFKQCESPLLSRTILSCRKGALPTLRSFRAVACWQILW